jgi:hypothetical protein
MGIFSNEALKNTDFPDGVFKMFPWSKDAGVAILHESRN